MQLKAERVQLLHRLQRPASSMGTPSEMERAGTRTTGRYWCARRGTGLTTGYVGILVAIGDQVLIAYAAYGKRTWNVRNAVCSGRLSS
jgi:hypothetical protein